MHKTSFDSLKLHEVPFRKTTSINGQPKFSAESECERFQWHDQQLGPDWKPSLTDSAGPLEIERDQGSQGRLNDHSRNQPIDVVSVISEGSEVARAKLNHARRTNPAIP